MTATGHPHPSPRHQAMDEAVRAAPAEHKPRLEVSAHHRGTGFLDRRNLRPGMAAPGTVLNNAFAAVGWSWGGRWASPDYQHFSKNGG